MKIINITLIIIVVFSCSINIKKENINKIVAYSNLDDTMLILYPDMFFDEDHLLYDISMKYMDESYYKCMIDTLSKYGVKQKFYIEPNPSYAFIVYHKNKNNDTLYTTMAMEKWWIIKDKKKEYIKDNDQKTLKFLSIYSKFFPLCKEYMTTE